MSNPFRSRDVAADRPPDPPRCRPARSSEIKSCLRLILGPRGRLAGEEQVLDFLRYALQRGMNLDDLWLVEQHGQIRWATLPVMSPGRTALLFSPSYVAEESHAAAAGLVDAVCDHCADRDVAMAQVLFDPTEAPLRRLYESCGFQALAELIYLQGPARRGARAPALPEGFTLQTYARSTHAAFARAIEQSYLDSLDCPALGGKRQIDDIIAGHKAAGEFTPDLWYLLSRGDRPLGVLLLSPSPGSECLELVYLGLAPEGRGQGLGDLLMQLALSQVHARGCASLTLAVDALNTPALKLYYRHGLRRLLSKLALVRELRPGAAATVAAT